jgi:hypothetical protein
MSIKPFTTDEMAAWITLELSQIQKPGYVLRPGEVNYDGSTQR